MTAILAVLETGAYLPIERALRAALASVAGPVGDSVSIHLQPGVALGIAQASIAQSTSHDVCAGFAADDDYVVLVDGSLYYLDDLCRTLGHRIGPSASTGQLVLAAFRALGAACVEKLEGDFAFLVWNKHTREVFCARDFTGRRPLYLAEWRDGLIVSTSLDSIAALPGFAPRINVGAVGADAAGLFFGLDDETCMHGVQSLRSGCTVQWKPSERMRGARAWHPEPAAPSRITFDEAAVTLRDLLTRAVAERMSESGPTAVWMSGGRDSPAVFAAGMHSMSGNGDARYLVPVSRSHPPNDSGREDEAIEEITSFWHVKPKWVDAQAVPLFPGLRHRDRWSSESFAQPFEGLARARKSRKVAGRFDCAGWLRRGFPVSGLPRVPRGSGISIESGSRRKRMAYDGSRERRSARLRQVRGSAALATVGEENAERDAWRTRGSGLDAENGSAVDQPSIRARALAR